MINEMVNHRIDVLSNTDKSFIEGTVKSVDWGLGIINSNVNTEVTKWLNDKNR